MMYSTASSLMIISMIYSLSYYCGTSGIPNENRTLLNSEEMTGSLRPSNDSLNKVDNTNTEKTKNEEDNNSSNINLSKKDIYKAGFKVKRAHQVAAVKQIMKIEDYAKQYKMVKLVLEKIFQILESSKLEVTQSTYIPGQEFPENKKELEALAHIIENTAFFGDILLRLPDITHEVYKSNKEWRLLVHWSVGFCNETGLFQGVDEKLLSLVAQELDLVPKDPSYVNPYKAEYQMEELKKKEDGKSKKQGKRKPSKKKSKKKKGPRLSHTDL